MEAAFLKAKVEELGCEFDAKVREFKTKKIEKTKKDKEAELISKINQESLTGMVNVATQIFEEETKNEGK